MFLPLLVKSNSIIIITALNFYTSLKLSFEFRKRDIFFIPLDKNLIRKNFYYVIIFKLRMSLGNNVPNILSELFISLRAISKAALSSRKEHSVPEEHTGYWHLRALAGERVNF